MESFGYMTRVRKVQKCLEINANDQKCVMRIIKNVCMYIYTLIYVYMYLYIYIYIIYTHIVRRKIDQCNAFCRK